MARSFAEILGREARLEMTGIGKICIIRDHGKINRTNTDITPVEKVY